MDHGGAGWPGIFRAKRTTSSRPMSTSTTPFVSRTRTAEAINVRLLDTISPLLELTSYQLLGASHIMVPSSLEGRVLQFGFSNIMLPDNSSDPLGSHGFVSFRLKPIVDLLVGEELTNAADIYFDIKPPIRTNTTTLIAELPEGMADLHRSIMRYPRTRQISVSRSCCLGMSGSL